MRPRVLALLHLVLVTGCMTPPPDGSHFSGVLSGASSDASIVRVDGVEWVDLRMHGGPLGLGAVLGPAVVRMEVLGIDPIHSPLLVVKAVGVGTGLVPELPASVRDARARALAALPPPQPDAPPAPLPPLPGDVFATDFAIYSDAEQRPCRIDLQRFAADGRLVVSERYCPIDRDPSLRFDGELQAAAR